MGVRVGVGMCERVRGGGRGYYKGMMHYVSTHVFAYMVTCLIFGPDEPPSPFLRQYF